MQIFYQLFFNYFLVPSKRLELLHYYYFMSASNADVSTKFHQEGIISTPEEI